MNFLARQLTPHITRALDVERVIAVMGARQTGKTTLVRQLLKTDRPVQYYNLKDPSVRAALQGDGARREFAHYAERLIILDEVQRLPELVERVQLDVDERPNVKGRFLLLGSNHLLLHRQVKESLAGRVALYRLDPLSFRELCGLDGPGLLSTLLEAESVGAAERILAEFYLPVQESAELLDRFRDFNLYGGYPEFLTRRDGQDRRNWLNSYRQTYLETDLRELVNLKSADVFERFESLFALRLGSLLNVSELARDCGVTADTVRRFVHYYRQLFIAWRLTPFFRNLGKRVMKSPKWYFSDTGLARCLLNNYRQDAGELFENTVLTDIRKQLYLSSLREDLFFIRTSTGVEVDAVFPLANPDTTAYCECKASNTYHPADTRHLKKFVEQDADGIGLLVTAGGTIEKINDRIWHVPAHWLLR